MGYLHINNLYSPRAQDILLFREVYALEKIHGTSTNIKYHSADGSITFFSGGTKHDAFVALFDEVTLKEKFAALGLPVDKTITVFGEGYGGKEQGMSATYGKQLRFVAFDVQIGDQWLNVDAAEKIVLALGLEFVYYKKVSCTNVVVTDGIKHFVELDAERDAYSEQSKRNGVEGWEKTKREGVVLRPLVEMTLNNGSRIIVKHKRDEFRETASPRNILVDPAKLAVLSAADDVANEWVTNERLNHVLGKMPEGGMEQIPLLIKNMTEDVIREGAEEIVDSQEVRRAIGRKTVLLYKAMLSANIGK